MSKYFDLTSLLPHDHPYQFRVMPRGTGKVLSASGTEYLTMVSAEYSVTSLTDMALFTHTPLEVSGDIIALIRAGKDINDLQLVREIIAERISRRYAGNDKS